MSNTIEQLIKQGNENFQNKRYKEAIKQNEKALEIDSENVKGLSLAEKGELEDALQCCKHN